MMVAKGIATKGSSQAFDYLLKEEKNAYVLDTHLLSGNTGQELLNDMRVIQNLNQKCFKNTFSFVLSAESSDSKKLTPKDLLDIKNEFLLDLSEQLNTQKGKKGVVSNIDLRNHMHLAVVHRNTKTFHTHILLNRIDESGIAAPDNHIAFKCQSAAKRVGQKFNLINAWDRHNEIERKRKKELQEYRRMLYQKHLNLLKMKPKNFENYIELMKNQDLLVIPSINKQGNIQGYRILDKKNGQNLKASEIHKQMTLKNLNPIFVKNSKLREKNQSI